MLPLKLTMEAFGPYLAPQVVDFTPFSDRFLIYGETGAGKTALLDAMTCALYNRASGGERGGIQDLRCKLAGPEQDTRVEFLFSVRGRRYLFWKRLRAVRRRKKDEDDRAERYVLECGARELLPDGGERSLLESAKPTAQEAAAVEAVGMGFEQFVQVMILPQGKFERFLTADSAEKERILKTLFRADRFAAYQESLARQCREAEERLRADERGHLARLRLVRGIQRLRKRLGTEAAAEQADADVVGKFGIQRVGKDAHVLHAGVAQGKEQLHIAPGEALFHFEIELRRFPQPPLPGGVFFDIGADVRPRQRLRLQRFIRAVFAREGIFQRLEQRVHAQPGQKVAQIADAGTHGLGALGAQLARIDAQVLLQPVKVGGDEQRAVVLLDLAALAEGVAGELAALHGEVVAAGGLAGDAQRAHGVEDEAQLPVLIVALRAGDEGKIEVAAVVVDRAAAGDAAHELHMVALHGGEVALGPRVLVAAQNDGVVVDVEVQRHFVRGDVFEKPLVRAEVRPAVAGCGYVEVIFHAFSHPAAPPGQGAASRPL